MRYARVDGEAGLIACILKQSIHLYQGLPSQFKFPIHKSKRHSTSLNLKNPIKPDPITTQNLQYIIPECIPPKRPSLKRPTGIPRFRHPRHFPNIHLFLHPLPHLHLHPIPIIKHVVLAAGAPTPRNPPIPYTRQDPYNRLDAEQILDVVPQVRRDAIEDVADAVGDGDEGRPDAACRRVFQDVAVDVTGAGSVGGLAVRGQAETRVGVVNLRCDVWNQEAPGVVRFDGREHPC